MSAGLEAARAAHNAAQFRVPPIDPDIVEAVDQMNPTGLAQRVAIEQTLQTRRDHGEMVLGVVSPAADFGSDLVNHPPHYTAHPSGVECITVVEHMGFNLGNAVKYIWRADEKGNALEDLEKARWYIDRELAKRGAE